MALVSREALRNMPVQSARSREKLLMLLGPAGGSKSVLTGSARSRYQIYSCTTQILCPTCYRGSAGSAGNKRRARRPELRIDGIQVAVRAGRGRGVWKQTGWLWPPVIQ